MSVARPSLNALRAFEATARLRSMTAAAEELAVTHGAVSRHVRSLEETFGLPLLVRGHHSLDPTLEGARLAERLLAAFNIIEASIEELKPGPLTLSCSSTIMMNWLIPRIAGFHIKHPHVSLKFDTNFDRVDFVRDKISVAIRNNTIAPPRDVDAKGLITEWVGPVCSPEYARLFGPHASPDLTKARRLSTRTRPEAWTEWARASGFACGDLEGHEFYDHFYMVIQAAVCGLGVGIVPRMLVTNDLKSGKLVAPWGFVPGPRELVLWIAPHLRGRPEVRALVSWLSAEMQQTRDEQR